MKRLKDVSFMAGSRLRMTLIAKHNRSLGFFLKRACRHFPYGSRYIMFVYEILHALERVYCIVGYITKRLPFVVFQNTSHILCDCSFFLCFTKVKFDLQLGFSPAFPCGLFFAFEPSWVWPNMKFCRLLTPFLPFCVWLLCPFHPV